MKMWGNRVIPNEFALPKSKSYVLRFRPPAAQLAAESIG